MSNLVTNKHKSQSHGDRPSKFQKQVANRKIRRLPCDSIEPRPVAGGNFDKLAKRKRSGKCPVCMSRLKHNRRMTRYVRQCEMCYAQLDPAITCPRCGTHRVWRGRLECRCKGCGKEVATT